MTAFQQRVGWILRTQGLYYLVTGVAPFVSRRGFEAVTGPKRDWWLAQTVGAVVSVIGGTLVAAAHKDRVTPEISGLAAGSAVALVALDVTYSGRGRNSHAYLLDALAQASFLAGLAAASDSSRKDDARRPRRSHP